MARDAKKAQKQKAKKDQKRKKKIQADKKQAREFLESNTTESINAKIDMALDLLDKGDPKRAETAVKKIKEKHGDRPYLHFAFGLIASKKGDSDSAIEYFENAAEMDENFVEAYVNLARIYSEEIDLKRAAFYLEQVIDLKDKSETLATEAQEHLEQIKDYCVKEYSLSLEECIDAQTFFEDGLDSLEEQELEAAIEKFEASLKIKTDSAFVYTNLAMAYAGLGRKAEALEALKTDLAFDSEDDFAKDLQGSIEGLADGELLTFEKF